MSVLCVAGQTYTFDVEVLDQADTKLFKTNPTIAAIDFRISVNGGAKAPLDNTPTIAPAAGETIQIVLSAAETTAAGAGGRIKIIGSDDTGSEWCDFSAGVRVSARDIDDHATSTALAAVDTNVDAILLDTGTDGVVVAAGSKTAYKLASDGLDQISAAEPTAKPTTFAGWIMWLVQRYRRSTLTSTTLTVMKEDDTTVTEQTVSDDGTTQSLGAPS